MGGDADGGPERPGAERNEPDAFAGLHWEQVRHASDPGGWGYWLTHSPGARRLAGCLAVADTAGIAVAVTLIAATLVRGRPIGGTWILLPPGILVLGAGQVWAILLIKARRPRGTRRRDWPRPASGSISRDLNLYFGPLDRRVTRTVAALSVTGIVSFITGIFFTLRGDPAGPGNGCRYRVAGHGVYTCVSKTAYDLAGAGDQRIVAGIFLFFVALHLYAALASGQGGQQTACEAVRPPAQ
jgi:hypothetical protein